VIVSALGNKAESKLYEFLSQGLGIAHDLSLVFLEFLCQGLP